MTTKESKVKKQKLIITPDMSNSRHINVRLISKPTQVNIMRIDSNGNNTLKHMMAQTYIIRSHDNKPEYAMHFVKAPYTFERITPESDIQYRWRVSKLTGALYIPVKIEKHLITPKLVGLGNYTINPQTNELILKKDNKNFGFIFSPDIDDNGNFSAVERRECEMEQARLALEGKQLLPEIDKPLYTDVKFVFNPKPTFYIWNKCSEYRKTKTSIHIQPNNFKILPLPPSTYHYSPYDYGVNYSYEYLSMLAGLGSDLMGQLVITIAEHMSGYDNQMDVYPPEFKKDEEPLPFQLPLPYKADPRFAKLLLLNRKYMIFITPIKKAKIKASSLLPLIAFNWEDEGVKWTGACDKQMQSGTFLEPEEYIQKYILNDYKVNFTNKPIPKVISKKAVCNLQYDKEQELLQKQQFEEQMKADRRQSRKSKKHNSVEIANS